MVSNLRGRLIFSVCTTLFSLFSFSLVSPAAIAKSPIANEIDPSQANLTFEIPSSKYVFSANGCARVPVTINWEKRDEDISVDITITASISGSSNTLSNWEYIGFFSDSSGTKTSTFIACSSDGPGLYDVSASIDVTDANASFTISSDNVDIGSFRLANATSSLGSLVAKRNSKVVSGKVLANRVGARGDITVKYKLPGTSKWLTNTDFWGVSTDQFGKFTASTGKKLIKGTTIKVTFSNCSWCTPISKTFKVK